MPPDCVMPQYSVIIASHRTQWIGDLIRSFTPAVYGSLPVEIIVVADYPIDRYRTHFPQVVWAHVPDNSISRKRNAGIALSKGTVCGFIDDDCMPGAGWIVQADMYLRNNPGHAGVEGKTIIDAPQVTHGALRDCRRLEKPGFRTNNIFYRKEALRLINGFDERFTLQREDIDLAFSLLENNMEIGYGREILVHHRFRTGDRWDLLKNCARRRFDPLLYKKHRALYRTHIKTPIPPVLSILLASYGASACILIGTRAPLPHILALNALLVTATTARRIMWMTSFSPVSLLREFISLPLAPLVLVASLIYGNVKYRTFLIV